MWGVGVWIIAPLLDDGWSMPQIRPIARESPESEQNSRLCLVYLSDYLAQMNTKRFIIYCNILHQHSFSWRLPNPRLTPKAAATPYKTGGVYPILSFC